MTAARPSESLSRVPASVNETFLFLFFLPLQLTTSAHIEIKRPFISALHSHIFHPRGNAGMALPCETARRYGGNRHWRIFRLTAFKCLLKEALHFLFANTFHFFALYLVGDWNKSLIPDDTCRGISIKSPLTLPSTVAQEGCQREAAK